MAKAKRHSKKRHSKPLRLYLVDPHTDEIVLSFAASRLVDAIATARREGDQIVIASSIAQAEDIATGTARGPMFWPGKMHRGHSKRKRTSKRTSRRRA